MANYTNLKNIIDQYITTNGQGDITGAILNDVLKSIVNSIGADFLFGGVVVPSSNVGTPDQNVFYIATQGGSYTNFGNVVIPNGITIFKWNGSWSNEVLFEDKLNYLKEDVNTCENQIIKLGGVLEYPLAYNVVHVKLTAWATTIADNLLMVAGFRYDITATLEAAATQNAYVQLRKGDVVLHSLTIPTGGQTVSFYYDVLESGDNYNVVIVSNDYQSNFHASATVVPRTTGSVIATIQKKQTNLSEKQGLMSTLLHNTTTKRYLSSNMFDGVYVSNKYINKSGVEGDDNNYGYTKNFIRVKKGDTITINDGSTIRSMRFVTAYNADYEVVVSAGAESVTSYIVPDDIEYIRISTSKSYIEGATFAVQNSLVVLPYDTYNAKDYPIDSGFDHDRHFILSSNIFDGEFLSGQGIRDTGASFSDNNYGVTKNFIPVDPGDSIVATNNNGLRLMRFICAYDKNFRVLADKGLSGGTYSYWAVPDGVYYLKITSPASIISAIDFAIYRSKGLVFKTPDQYNIVDTDNRNLLRIKRTPLSLMPNYITQALSYRPLGCLTKGYICMMTDDGTAGLASYTIPLAIRENIPMTFAVMKESAVFADGTMTATVLDAVNNHNCDLAQHGGTLWDLMSEIDLNNFFDDEKAFFDNLGVELKGAAIPQHRTNSLVKAVAGARFGVVRSGYSGQGEDDNPNDSITNYYDYYTSGARSNLFGLSSYNCAGTSISYNHSAADYAKNNNKILIVYFHEFDTGAQQQVVVEDLITYAKSIGLEFIKLGDIPTLETWDNNN